MSAYTDLVNKRVQVTTLDDKVHAGTLVKVDDNALIIYSERINSGEPTNIIVPISSVSFIEEI